MIEAVAVVAVIATVGLSISNILLIKFLRFCVNTAVSRTPLELAQRQTVTEDKRPQPKREPRPRPEGI